MGYRHKVGHFEPVDENFPARKSQKQGLPEEPYSTGCPGLSR